jgi:aldehyde dehydrogenase (NAD+)
MAAAARHLASVTLELGGKSPVVVDETADITATAQRLCFGKFINAGQTCVAPDYVLVNEQVADSLAAALKATIEQFYGPTDDARLDNDNFASLVDERSLARIEAATKDTIAQGARLIIGGRRHPAQPRRYAPTVLADVPNDSAIMREEIFGPVLPLLKVRSLDEAIAIIRARPKPLALYVFSRDEAKIERVLSETTAGGSTVNNTLLHLANLNLPFGGVGESGLGRYHGRFGFETFSHARAVYKQVAPSGVKLMFPPYVKRRARLLQLVGLMDKSLE